jgi:hypothetical protein
MKDRFLPFLVYRKIRFSFIAPYAFLLLFTLSTVAMVVGLAQPQVVQATTPKIIYYQGKISKTSDGTNIANGSYSMQFKIYSASSSGSLLWTETWDGTSGTAQVTFVNGLFSVALGTYTSLSTVDFSTGSLYLTANFNPGAGYDGEMSPRQQLTSTPFAISANGVSGDGTINTTVSSATALTVANTGANYGFQVDTSTASSATGIKIKSAAAAGGAALSVISSGTDENLTIDAKGAGTISLGATSTGNLLLGGATGDILLGGGSSSTGCTVTNSTGALACTAGGSFTTLALTGAVTGAASYNGLVVTANTGVVTTGTWNGTAVDVAHGGTGVGTLASNGILYGNGTGTVQALAANSGGTLCLTQASSAAPTWSSCGTGGGISFAPSSADSTASTNSIENITASGLVSNNFINLKTTTSAFAGTGLLMDFANASGSFSGNFLDFRVNTASKFTVNSAGSITKVGTNITGGAGLTIASTAADLAFATTTSGNITFAPASTGSVSITSGTTTGTTTTSGLAFNGNSLTTGTGVYAASSSLTSGKLLDLQVSGSAAITGQTGLNISTSGAVSGLDTTYGAYISNTHTGVIATNVAAYFNASGAAVNVAAIFDHGYVGIGTTQPNFPLHVVAAPGTGAVAAFFQPDDSSGGYIGNIQAGAQSAFGLYEAGGDGILAEYNESEGLYKYGGGIMVAEVGTGLGIGTGSAPSFRLDVLNATTAQTSDNRVANFENGGATFNTTGGALNSYGGYFASTSTRSSGSNALTNVGLYATASGAQNNYSAVFDKANILQTAGSLKIAGTIKDDTNLGNAVWLAAQGNYVYVANQEITVGHSNFAVIDVTKPTAPAIVGTLDDDTNLYFLTGVAVSGRYAYTVSGNNAVSGKKEFSVIDLANPTAPDIAGTIDDNTNLYYPYAVAVSGGYAYVAADTNGTAGKKDFTIVDISNPAAPAVVGSLEDKTNLYKIRSVYIQGIYAYVVSQNTTGGKSNLSIIDISNPTLPFVIGTLDDDTNLAAAYTVEVRGRYAYVGTQTSGTGGAHAFTVVDVSNPVSPTVVSSLTNDSNHYFYDNYVTVAGNYAYVTTEDDTFAGGPGQNNLSVVDISNPSSPTVVGTLDDDLNLVQSIKSVVVGKYLYVVNLDSSGVYKNFTVVDISGLETPTANVGSFQAGILNVSQNASIANTLNVQNSVTVGQGGIQSSGSISMQGDAMNIIFGNSAGVAPAGTVTSLYSDNSGDITSNVLTGKTFNLSVGGVDEYNFSSTALAMNGNNITGGGSIAGTTFTNAGALAITTTASNGNISLTPNGTGSVAITSGATTGNASSITAASFAPAAAASGSGLNLTYSNVSTNSSGTSIVNGLLLTPTQNITAGAGAHQTNGINLGAIATNTCTGGGTCQKYGIYAASSNNYTDLFNYNGTSVINSTGQLNAAQLTGTVPTGSVLGSYTSLTGTGTLTAGATGAGFTVALGTSTITGTLSPTNGGTNSQFFGVTGPTTSTKTFTFPDASATVLTTNAAVTVAQGGTGIGTLALNGILYGNGTSAVQALAVNAGATQCLTQASSAAPAWGSCGGGGISLAPSSADSTASTNSIENITATGLTSGNFINIKHTTSTFTGTGLKMDFANATGAFSGNFLDFQVNTVSKFTMSGTGLTFAPTASTSGTPTLLTLTAPAHTTLAASTEAIDVNINLARTVQFTAGSTIALQRGMVVQAPSYGFTGSNTITDAATLAITGAAASQTNATITNTHGLLISAGAVQPAGTVTNAYGLTVNAPTGATNNFAAQFVSSQTGGTIFKVTNPSSTTPTSTILATDISLSSYTPAAGLAFRGQRILLPSNSNIGATTEEGLLIQVSGSSITQNTAAATGTYNGVDIINPAITLTSGTALTANALKVSTATINTGGTQNGLDVTLVSSGTTGTQNGVNINNISAGAGAAYNGVNIGTISGGAGVETALNIGSGWDLGLAVAGNPSASATGASVKLANALSSGSSGGTFLAANAVTGFTGDFFNFQLNNGARAKLDSTGALTVVSCTGCGGSSGISLAPSSADSTASTNSIENITATGLTSNNFLNLVHSTSAFTGTGLFLDFASGSGTFNSGNFLDFRNNAGAATSSANSVFSVSNTGNVIHRSSTNSATAFQVENSAGAPLFLVDTTSTDPAGAQVNYLTYPGFESGSFSNAAAGWTATGSTLTQNTNKQHTYNGLFSASVVSTATAQGIHTGSFVSAPPGSTSYIVSFYVKISTGTIASSSFTVTTTGGAGTCNVGIGTTINSSGFQRLSCTVTAGAGTITDLAITQTAGANTIYYDSVQMQKTTYNGSAITLPTAYQIGQLQLRGLITNPMTLQNNGDSTSAFQVNNANGTTSVLAVDTLNSGVSVNSLATTTTAMQVNANSLTSGSGLVVSSTASGASSRLFYVNSAATSNGGTGVAVFNFALTSGSGLRVINGANGGTAVSIDASAMNTGTALAIDATAMTSGTGVTISGGTSTTGNLLVVSSTSTAVPAAGLVRFNMSGIRTAAGVGFQIDDASTTLATAMQLNANSLTSGNGLVISATATGLTGSALSVTTGSTSAPTNGLVYYNFNGIRTGAGVGFQITDVSTTLATAMRVTANSLTTGLGLSIASSSTGLTTAGTDVGSLLNIVESGAMTGMTGQLVAINASGANTVGSTGVALDINLAGTAQVMQGIKITSASTAATVTMMTMAYSGNPTAAVTQRYIAFTANAGTLQGQITRSATTGNVLYTATSDARIKHDITDTHFNLSDLMHLKIRDYKMNDDPNNTILTGFVAQELNAVYPEAVASNGDNGLTPLAPGATPWTVDYGRVTPLLVKAIQDQQNLLGAFITKDTPGLSTLATDINNETPRDPAAILAANITAGKPFLTDFFAARVTAARGYFSDAFTKNLTAGLQITSTDIKAKGLKIDTITANGNIIRFMSDTSFIGRPYFNNDTAGFAQITEGARKVTIQFTDEYLTQPIVSVGITLNAPDGYSEATPEEVKTMQTDDEQNAQALFDLGLQYVVINKNEHGFTILLNKAAPKDISFSWIALAVKDAKLSLSKAGDDVSLAQPGQVAGDSTDTPNVSTAPESDTSGSEVSPPQSPDQNQDNSPVEDGTAVSTDDLTTP